MKIKQISPDTFEMDSGLRFSLVADKPSIYSRILMRWFHDFYARKMALKLAEIMSYAPRKRR